MGDLGYHVGDILDRFNDFGECGAGAVDQLDALLDLAVCW